MIPHHEVESLRQRPDADLRELAAHIASLLAEKGDLDQAAAVYHRIGDRLDGLRRRAMS